MKVKNISRSLTIKTKAKSLILLCLMLGMTIPALANDIGSPDPESIKGLYPGKTYSPYAQRSFPDQIYWGETHLHTGLSLDAGLFGATIGHEGAYRLARGEEIKSSTGLPVKLSRPLDWLVITDHTDLMGIAADIQKRAPNIMAVPKGKEWAEGFAKGGQAAGEAAFDLITHFAQGKIPEQFLKDYSPGSPVYNNLWDEIIDAAEQYNDPGRFTALIGFEWTSIPKGFNLHRNVILRDNGDRARQVIPLTTQPPMGSTDPLVLYQWLEDYEAKTGGRAFAISHNGNLSNGWMFPTEITYAGGRVDKNYVQLRNKWEPLYEVTQIKGDSEAHPGLSPNDEFADYGTWDKGNLDLTELKTLDMLQREYAREALKNGLKLEEKFGTNPYKFGMVGSTDSHTGLATAQEDNFFGKHSGAEPNPKRVYHPMAKIGDNEYPGWSMVASGYQGIWASENTREALFDAMMRKETYGTTGPRMLVRFFGGWDYGEDEVFRPDVVSIGYRKGVPMGGDLPKAPEGKNAPVFMVGALKDAWSGNLDRIQIVKGWLDGRKELHERVYDVAVSDGRSISADGRCRTQVGNTVDVASASYTNTIGDPLLAAHWGDPDFDPSEHAFYYVRVLENPSCRWNQYECNNIPKAERPTGCTAPKVPRTIQERLWTSPIWYSGEPR